jgi:hypothetical protein
MIVSDLKMQIAATRMALPLQACVVRIKDSMISNIPFAVQYI